MDFDREQLKEQVFAQLKNFVASIIGDDIVEELNITRDSIFTKDLEMDSIEIVAFAEKVKSYYGHEIDFTNWLSGLDLEELINLSFNRIIDFIADALIANMQKGG